MSECYSYTILPTGCPKDGSDQGPKCLRTEMTTHPPNLWNLHPSIHNTKARFQVHSSSRHGRIRVRVSVRIRARVRARFRIRVSRLGLGLGFAVRVSKSC